MKSQDFVLMGDKSWTVKDQLSSFKIQIMYQQQQAANNKFKNSFSWSFSRYNLFRYCERAYYFHYYGSWNGWDTYAPEQIKEAYRLKQLISKELWLNIVLKKSLLNAINSKPLSSRTFAAEFEHKSHRVLSSDITSLYSEEWQNDPKKICIDKIYYKENSIDKITAWIRNKTAVKVKLFRESKLFYELSSLPFPAFLDTNHPLSFTQNNIQIWCSPDLMWTFHGKLNILNLNNGSGWSFIAGLNMLYARQNNNHVPSSIVCRTAFIDKDSYFSVYGIRSPKEIMNIITDSSEEMRSRLTFDKKAYIENFPKTTEQEKCQTCRFKAICLL